MELGTRGKRQGKRQQGSGNKFDKVITRNNSWLPDGDEACL
jgi:hypothetical protein